MNLVDSARYDAIIQCAEEAEAWGDYTTNTLADLAATFRAWAESLKESNGH